MNSPKQVVGVAFIKDNRLLVVQSKKSQKNNAYTFVGGGVEEGENLIEACVREVSEEIHNGFTIAPHELELVMTKTETAASDSNLTIEMHVFLAHKDIDVELIPNEEILIYHWYAIGEDLNISNSIKDFLDIAAKKGVINIEA
ncbi:MAG: NUDIX domain-containing protein [Bacilli bacterium]|nr:NUDIX domain-containing protein [Bacilli bacterium]